MSKLSVGDNDKLTDYIYENENMKARFYHSRLTRYYNTTEVQEKQIRDKEETAADPIGPWQIIINDIFHTNLYE